MEGVEASRSLNRPCSANLRPAGGQDTAVGQSRRSPLAKGATRFAETLGLGAYHVPDRSSHENSPTGASETTPLGSSTPHVSWRVRRLSGPTSDPTTSLGPLGRRQRGASNRPTSLTVSDTRKVRASRRWSKRVRPLGAVGRSRRALTPVPSRPVERVAHAREAGALGFAVPSRRLACSDPMAT
jgi:hypothetical protein